MKKIPIIPTLKASFWWTLFILLGLALVCARVSFGLIPLPSAEPLPEGLSWINASETSAHKVMWVDARAEAAYQKGHIHGAINVTMKNYDRDFGRFADLWRPGCLVVVYCDGGGCQLSREVAERLKVSLPTADIRVLKGGYPVWLKK